MENEVWGGWRKDLIDLFSEGGGSFLQPMYVHSSEFLEEVVCSRLGYEKYEEKKKEWKDLNIGDR
jgi:hypothetical protein